MLPLNNIGMSGSSAGLIGGPVAGVALFTGIYLRKKYLALKVSEQRKIHRTARDIFLCMGGGVAMRIFVTMPNPAERRAADHIEDVVDEIADLYDKFKVLGVEINNLSSKLRIEKKQIKAVAKCLENLEDSPKKEDIKSLHRVHEAAATQYKLVIVEKEEEQKLCLAKIQNRVEVLHPLHLGAYDEIDDVDDDIAEQKDNGELDHAINSNVVDIESGRSGYISALDEEDDSKEDFCETKGQSLNLVKMGNSRQQVQEKSKKNIYGLEEKDLAVMEFNRLSMESTPNQNATLLVSNEALENSPISSSSSSSSTAQAIVSSNWWDFFE